MSVFLENIRLRIGRFLNKPQTSNGSAVVSPKNVRNILIICDVSTPDINIAISTLKTRLRQICPQTNIVFVNFSPRRYREDKTMISDKNVEYITEHDFGFFFNIKNQTLHEYLSAEYDIFIKLTCSKQLYIDFISEYVKSPLKIGHSKANNELFNLAVDLKSNDIKVLANSICDIYSMMFGH